MFGKPWKSLTQAETYIYKGGHTSLILFSLVKSGYIAVDVTKDVEELDARFCLCEVVMHNTARPCIDFDIDIGDKMDQIELAVKVYYETINNLQVVCKWKVAKDESRTSWHLVVNGVYYYMCWMEESKRLADFIEQALNIKTDKAVYQRGKGLRLLGQYKPGNVRKLTKYSEGNYRDFLLYPNGDTLLAKTVGQSFQTTPNPSPVNSAPNSAPNTPPSSPRGTSYGTRRNWISGITVNPRYLPVMHGLILSHIKNGYYIYTRKFSTTCPICKRTHDSDNMFGYLTKEGKFRVKCWRNYHESDGSEFVEFLLPKEAYVRGV